MSKRRKRVNETMTAAGETVKKVNGSNAIICPATSSTTTLPGSFRPDHSSVLEAAQIPESVSTRIESRTTTNDELSSKKIPTPTSDPNVPGIRGKKPTPNVAIARAR